MKTALIILGIIICLYLITTYPGYVIAVVVLAIGGNIAYYIAKRRKAAKTATELPPQTAVPSTPSEVPAAPVSARATQNASEPALIPQPELKSEPAPIPQLEAKPASIPRPEAKPEAEATPQPKPKPRNPRLEQFKKELGAITRVDIALSEPVAKRRLMDMPPFTFSNVTRATRFDSIFPLVFLDVETTGLYPTKDDIIEVSAIKFDYGMNPISCFTTLCKPRKPIPEEATKINHITDDMVASAPEFSQVAPALTDYIRGCNVAGHNLEFDLRFIFVHGADFPEDKRLYDTLDLARRTIRKSSGYGYDLGSVCVYYGIWRDQAHRSLSDCYATSKIFSSLVFDKTSRRLELSEELELSH